MKFKIDKDEYVNKTFKINIKLLREMEKICRKNGISLNKLIDRCICYSLDNLDTADE